jgi:hypothetical protein
MTDTNSSELYRLREENKKLREEVKNLTELLVATSGAIEREATSILAIKGILDRVPAAVKKRKVEESANNNKTDNASISPAAAD